MRVIYIILSVAGWAWLALFGTYLYYRLRRRVPGGRQGLMVGPDSGGQSVGCRPRTAQSTQPAEQQHPAGGTEA